MTSRVEDRLREALVEVGATVDAGALRPLREPQRTRFRVDFRLVTAAAAVVVLAGAATAVWLSGPGAEDRAVAADPAPAESTEVAVFLCTKSAPKNSSCQGRDASRAEREAIERTLKELPQLKEVLYTDQTAAYTNFRAAFAHNKAVLDAVKPADLPASFRLKFKKGADPKEVEKALRGMSGVRSVRPQALPSAEQRKPLISVFLCGKGSAMPACGAERESRGKDGFKVTKDGKAATAAQTRAIEKTIKAMPGVQEVVFEDQAAAYENFMRTYRGRKELVKVTDLPESFRVMMKPEAEWVPVVRQMRRQPGVSQVIYAPCYADLSELQTAYELLLPDDKVCPTGK
ncbi:permease-like cell division protein FtsX [Nonomuraea sp. NPDC049400]|uniref:permease-like cell division protein FtsX n=1 Tax=Nonomuraea sp. NPDC049400 TaxID=3364352 RepID=UPI0037BA749F